MHKTLYYRMFTVTFSLAILGLLGCGESKPFEGELQTIAQYEIRGSFDGVPEVSVTNLGTTRLASLIIEAETVAFGGEKRTFSEIDFERRQSITFRNPHTGACQLSQMQVSRVSSEPQRVEVVLWGWDSASENRPCEALLRRVAVEGLELELTGVWLALGQTIDKVAVRLQPSRELK